MSVQSLMETSVHDESWGSIALSPPATPRLEPSISASARGPQAQSHLHEIAREVANEHLALEPDVSLVAVYANDVDTQIRLIEVNATTPPTGAVLAFQFAPSTAVPVPTFIADVTPKEWKRIQRGRMQLPEGWPLEPSFIVERTNP